MNDKDQEAFEKWKKQVIQENPGQYSWISSLIPASWEAACEYKEAENKKLREALEFYAEYKNDDPDDDYNYDVAREALKEVEKK